MPETIPAITLPAEWAPQSRVMLTWPRRDGDFAPIFDEVEKSFSTLARCISQYEALQVNTSTNGTQLRQRLLNAGIAGHRLYLHEVPSDDVWARDHGPITVWRDGRCLHLDFQFNGWGGKFPFARDNALTQALAQTGAWDAPVQRVDFVLEGGAIDTDGCGTLLTTERCLLAPTRNPRLGRAEIEAVLRETLGVSRVLWLRHGHLLGDDTDGHVDTVARFCNPHTLAYQACEDPSDAHAAELDAMAAELSALHDANGRAYQLVPLPLPPPIHAADGQRLPAGYANFLIINGAVLVPAYGVDQDSEALARLRPHFPGRDIIGVDCRALIKQYGSLHCVTMQIPCEPETVPS